MPRRDGTGPGGQGPMTGRGLGNCPGVQNVSYGFGNGFGNGFGMRNRMGCGFGFQKFYHSEPIAYKSKKIFLAEQKEMLTNYLKNINDQLNELVDE